MFKIRSLVFGLGLVATASVAYAQTDGAAEAAPAEAAAEAPAVAAQAAAPGGADEQATYELRLREAEDRINELKENIFRSKSRLFLLREQILRDNIGGSKLMLTLENKASNAFSLDRVTIYLDGTQIFAADAGSTDIEETTRREIHNASLVPGPHEVYVEMRYVGNGYGVFSYMDGYNYVVSNTLDFIVDQGFTKDITILGGEKRGASVELSDRIDIKFEAQDYQTVAPPTVEGENGGT